MIESGLVCCCLFSWLLFINFQDSSDNGTTWTALNNNGSGSFAVTITPAADYKSATITFVNPLSAGNYKLRIAQDGTTDISDFANYYVPKVAFDFTVGVPTTVAQATDLTVNSRTEVIVNFSAPVDTPANTTCYWNTDGLVTSNTNTANTVTKLSDTSFKYTFTTNVIPTGAVTFFVKNVIDAYGNSVPTASFNKTVASDAAATASVTVVDDHTIDVVFSKAMQNISATTTYDANNKTYYTITDSNNNAVNISSATYSAVGTTYKTRLALASSIKGTYIIAVSGIKDVVGQLMTPLTQSITVTDTTKPAMASVTAYGSNIALKIVVSYPEAMSTSGQYSITNINNYEYAADGSTWDVLPTGTILTASADAKSVTISLPVGATLTTGTSKIGIGRVAASTIYTVADAAGNILDTLPGASTRILVNDDAVPTISGQAVSIISANQLKVAVGTAQLANVVATDFQYTLDNGANWKSASAASLSTSGGTQYVTITLASTDTMSAATLMSDVKVKTINTGTASKTALGTPIATGVTSAAASNTVFAASIKTVQIQDATHLIVTFDGKIPSAQFTNLNNSLALYQNGTKVTTTFSAAGSDPATIVTITLGTAIDPTVDVTLKTVSQDFMLTTDQNGKLLTANTTGIVGSATLVATTLAKNFAGTNIADGDTLVITYNMALDTTSINSSWTGASTTATVSIDATGKLTVSGYSIGQITGMTAAAGTWATSTIAYNTTSRTITITFGGTGSQTVAVPAGTITYTPAATIKSVTGLPICTTVTPSV